MSERCSQCGLPMYVCQNEDNEIQFRIEERQCAAIVAKSRYEELHKEDKRAGISLIPEPYSTEGRDLTDYREPYYRTLAEQRLEQQISH